MSYEDEKFTGYDNTNIVNAVATVLFVTGAMLSKEGYRQEDVTQIMEKIGMLTGAIFKGEAVITRSGIMPVEKSNVVSIQ